MFYHATNHNNSFEILKRKKLVTSYGEETGIYLTKDLEHAKLFGSYVFCIDECLIDKDKLEIDDVNDGVFHKGELKLSFPFLLKVMPTKRVGLDQYNSFVDEEDSMTWIEWGKAKESLVNFFTPKQVFTFTC